MWIREGDTVAVTKGDDVRSLEPHERPLKAKVLKVYRERQKVLVEGVNRVYKHVRPTQQNPKGGRLSKEMPISIANVKLVCPSCGQPARVGARFTDDGAKVRYCKKCDATIGEIAPRHTSHAKQ